MSNWAIEKHHREMLGKETGTVVKDPGGKLRVALLYPNTYQVGLANLGFQTVYRIINARDDALCERAFLPGREETALYKKCGAPLLTLESSRPVAEFDLVLASLSFENDAPNLAAMLEMAGLSMGAGPGREPWVVLGGVAAMLNPEPLAGLADAFLLGEAEVVLDPFLDTLRETAGQRREEALIRLSREAPEFYAPSLFRVEYNSDGTIRARIPLADVPEKVAVPRYAGPAQGLARSVINAPGPELGEMTLLEVGRGCGHACRFCAAGHVYRPPRLGQGPEFLGPALEAASRGGKVGLVSAAVSDLAGVDELARRVVEAGGQISVSSLRADRLGPDLVDALAKSRHQTVALAPEAGSARLRRIINKHLTEEGLFRGVEALMKGGVPNLRLYFMVGLPGEEEEDIEELVALVRRVRQQMVSLSREKGHLGLLTVSLNAFVPKPWTPFQWEPMAPLKVIKRRMDRVKKALAYTANLKVVNDVPKYARLQGVLARGDRRVGPLVEALARGAKPEEAYREAGVDPDFHAHRRRERDEALPWDFVDQGISKDYLWLEAGRAREGKESPDCLPETCRRCGVCG